MEIMVIAITIATLAGIGYGLYRAYEWVNNTAESEYGYAPLTLWTITPFAVAYVLLIVSCCLKEPKNNVIGAVVVLVIVTIVVALYIQSKSSLRFATYAVPLLHIGGVLSVIVLVGFIAAFLLKDRRRGNW